MPTYQYRCTECGRDLEVVQKFSDASLTECPACAGQLRKVFNAVGVVFKGSGFYRNDSRAAAGSSDAGGAEKKTDKPTEKSSESGNSKPAKTETSKPDKVAATASSGGSSTGSKAASD
jgi:putative FmdB family regulatory protein